MLNVIPAFAPPTWLTVAFIGLTIPEIEVWRLVPVAAGAATLGRLSLAKLSRRIVRKNFLSEAVRRNIDAIKHGLERRGKLTFGLFLLYAFGPLPSNYLFIAYGLTTLRLAAIAAPFFIGRSCSYGVSIDGRLLGRRQYRPGARRFFRFLLRAVAAAVGAGDLLLHRIDWHGVIEKRRLSWLKTAGSAPP